MRICKKCGYEFKEGRKHQTLCNLCFNLRQIQGAYKRRGTRGRNIIGLIR